MDKSKSAVARRRQLTAIGVLFGTLAFLLFRFANDNRSDYKVTSLFFIDVTSWPHYLISWLPLDLALCIAYSIGLALFGPISWKKIEAAIDNPSVIKASDETVHAAYWRILKIVWPALVGVCVDGILLFSMLDAASWGWLTSLSAALIGVGLGLMGLVLAAIATTIIIYVCAGLNYLWNLEWFVRLRYKPQHQAGLQAKPGYLERLKMTRLGDLAERCQHFFRADDVPEDFPTTLPAQPHAGNQGVFDPPAGTSSINVGRSPGVPRNSG